MFGFGKSKKQPRQPVLELEITEDGRGYPAKVVTLVVTTTMSLYEGPDGFSKRPMSGIDGKYVFTREVGTAKPSEIAIAIQKWVVGTAIGYFPTFGVETGTEIKVL